MNWLFLKHLITIATARPDAVGLATACWLHRRGFHYDCFAHCEHQRKADLAGDVLVDDNAENCQEFAATGRTAILFDQPWNRQFIPGDGSRVIRAKGWGDVRRILGYRKGW